MSELLTILSMFFYYLAVAGFRFSPGCCCEPGCTFFSDDFNRADSDDPGAYTEVSGDWDIVSDKLSTSSSDGVLIADAQHPEGEPNIKVSVTVNIATDGDIARIILDYLDSSNYWFAEVKAGTGAYLRIYQRSSGSNTLKAGISLTISTGSHEMCASIFDSVLRVFFDVTGGVLSESGTFANSAWGLGTGSLTGTITVDAVSASKTSEQCMPCGSATILEDCPGCAGDAANEYQVEIPASSLTGSTFCTSGDCSGFAGVHILPFATFVGSGGCLWSIGTNKGYFAGLCPACFSASGPPLNFDINRVGSGPFTYFALVTTGSGTGPEWYKELSGESSPINCDQLNDEEFDSFVNGVCCHSSGPCYVTAILPP